MCTVEAYVFGAKRGRRLGKASPFPPFLSLIHILPICFDSAQVLYIYSHITFQDEFCTRIPKLSNQNKVYIWCSVLIGCFSLEYEYKLNYIYVITIAYYYEKRVSYSACLKYLCNFVCCYCTVIIFLLCLQRVPYLDNKWTRLSDREIIYIGNHQ